MFNPVKVTPIKVKDEIIIECEPIIVDMGDYCGFDEVVINGRIYCELSFVYDNMPPETICIKERFRNMENDLIGG